MKRGVPGLPQRVPSASRTSLSLCLASNEARRSRTSPTRPQRLPTSPSSWPHFQRSEVFPDFLNTSPAPPRTSPSLPTPAGPSHQLRPHFIGSGDFHIPPNTCRTSPPPPASLPTKRGLAGPPSLLQTRFQQSEVSILLPISSALASNEAGALSTPPQVSPIPHLTANTIQ